MAQRYQMHSSERSKLWELISKKRTKDGWDEISRIDSVIREVVENAYLSGLNDAVEALQGRDEHLLAVDELYKRFFPERLTEEDAQPGDVCRWCNDGPPEWSPWAKVWIHRRDRLDRKCENQRSAPDDNAANPKTIRDEEVA